MPGIAGFINRKFGEMGEETLELMVKCMKHENFYTSGKYVNKKMGVHIGWAVHQGSFSDCLPIHNERKDIILIFYGENHIDIDILESIQKKSHGISNSNASYLVSLYEQDEGNFFESLNGWFCGLIIDLRDKKAVLFNDRYGMQRLYIYEEKGCVYFASEAKSILKVKPELRVINPDGLADILVNQCVLGNRSLFEKVRLLPCASCWEFAKDKKCYRGKYFDPKKYEELPALRRDIFLNKLKNTLVKILPRYFPLKDQIAFSLTGGLDTRTILSNLSEVPSNVRFYTHAGAYRDCFDAKIAREVGEFLSVRHHTLRIDDKFYDDFPELARKTVYITDGCMDLSGTPSLYLHSKTRNIGNIRFNGNFGDQVLACRTNLRNSNQKQEMFNDTLRTHMDKGGERYIEYVSENPQTLFYFNQVPWFNYARYSLEQSQLVQRSPFMDNDLTELLYQAPEGVLTKEDIRIWLIQEGNAELLKIPTDRGLLGSKYFLIRNSLNLYRELLFKFEYYFSYGMPHWLSVLNSAFGFLRLDYLFLERHKYYNLRRWYRYELSEYVKSILLDSRTLNRSFINRRFVENMVDKHISGRGNYTLEINRLLSLELSIRSLIEEI